MHKTDAELVQAIRRGDVESFVALCGRYYRPMLAIARAILRDGHLAEDAVQETFAKACRRLDTLQDPGRCGAWLAVICRHEAHNVLRRRRAVAPLGEHDIPISPPQADSPVEAVHQALDALPPESRELLYLHYRSELSYVQIAALWRISPEAVHGRLRRARLQVKALLARAQSGRPS